MFADRHISNTRGKKLESPKMEWPLVTRYSHQVSWSPTSNCKDTWDFHGDEDPSHVLLGVPCCPEDGSSMALRSVRILPHLYTVS